MRRVALTPTARVDFDRLPVSMRNRVLMLFERLGRWPNVSGARRLSGRLSGYHRVRTGDYRVVYRVTATEVAIERIAHRRDVYET